jgi:16S rRNA C1402 N4-methylase RsmH
MNLDPKGAARDLITKTSKEIVETIMKAIENNYTKEVMEQLTENRINQFIREMTVIARTIKAVTPEQKS